LLLLQLLLHAEQHCWIKCAVLLLLPLAHCCQCSSSFGVRFEKVIILKLLLLLLLVLFISKTACKCAACSLALAAVTAATPCVILDAT
jgi:hypothetical protein